ncbi:MAG: MFS transporter [Bdellovibrionota bacterium]|nr:MFS transporter [Bdellovibrionota bacterium]
MNKSLFSLAIGGFAIGLTEFVIMGMLPDVASDLSISITQAGSLISMYALGVVIGAPILAGGTSRFRPNLVIIVMMTAFAFANFLSVISPNFEFLLVSRFFSGLPHGAFFGVGAVVASRLAPKGKQASAVAAMFSGLTIANVIGVPLGTYIGHHFSWRITFALVALIGMTCAISAKFWIPQLEGIKSASFKKDLKIIKKPELLLIVAITSIGTGGLFALLSYIAPFSINVSKLPESWMPYLMVIAGLGMTAGNMLGGKVADRVAPRFAILIFLGSLVLILSGIYIFGENIYVLGGLVFAATAAALALASPLQMLLIKNSKEAEMLGSSLGQSSFNIGNALGAFLGGMPIAMGYGFQSSLLVGISLAGAGVLLSLLYIYTHHNSSKLQRTDSLAECNT